MLQDKWVVLPEAVSYQYDQNNAITPLPWTAEYTPNNGNGTVGFTFATYDHTKALVLLIGPPPLQEGPSVFTNGVCWSTYFGGDANDFIFGSRIDLNGNYCVTGQTWSTIASFPAQTGTVTLSAGTAAYAARFNDDDQLIWSSYFGCSTGLQWGYNCVVPSSGNELFIGGKLNGPDIAVPPFQPAGRYVNTTFTSGGQGFLASFNMITGALFWSTYFGGTSSQVYNIDFDTQDNLYVCGTTTGSLPQPTELTPPTGFTPFSYTLGQDGFLTKLNNQFKVWWSTYMGGSGSDAAQGMRVGTGKVVVAGITSSPTFQTMTAGSGQAHNHSTSPYAVDILIEEFNLDGIQQWGSFFSYDGLIGLNGLALNRENGDLYLAGSFDPGQIAMPVSTDAPWYQNGVSNGFRNSFIWQIGADHIRKYSTHILGSGGDNVLKCIDVDFESQIYAAGYTKAASMSTQCAGDLYCATTPQAVGDGYVVVITAEHWRSWLTFFGGNTDTDGNFEQIRTLALKGSDRLYVAGETWSSCDDQQGLFFPLHDELGGAWWDSELDAANESDGFVSAFCIGDILTGFTGIEDHQRIDHSTMGFVNSNGSIEVWGLEPGRFPAFLYDASGRIVRSDQRTVPASGKVSWNVGELSDGWYFLRIGDINGGFMVTH